MPSSLASTSKTLLFLLLLLPFVKSTTPPPCSFTRTYTALLSGKKSLTNSGLPCFFPTCSVATLSILSPAALFFSHFLHRQSQTSQALESELIAALSFKSSTTDTLSLLTIPSHQKIPIECRKSSSLRKKISQHHHRQHLRSKLGEALFYFKPYSYSTRPSASFPLKPYPKQSDWAPNIRLFYLSRKHGSVSAQCCYLLFQRFFWLRPSFKEYLSRKNYFFLARPHALIAFATALFVRREACGVRQQKKTQTPSQLFSPWSRAFSEVPFVRSRSADT